MKQTTREQLMKATQTKANEAKSTNESSAYTNCVFALMMAEDFEDAYNRIKKSIEESTWRCQSVMNGTDENAQTCCDEQLNAYYDVMTALFAAHYDEQKEERR